MQVPLHAIGSAKAETREEKERREVIAARRRFMVNNERPTLDKTTKDKTLKP